jgi:hypothetical protein
MDYRGALALARALEKLGRATEARGALRLVSSRDPESAAAHHLSASGADPDHVV